MSSLLETRLDNLTEVRAMNENVMHFVPINSVVYREVLLLALSGEQDAAQLQLERAIWAFPEGLSGNFGAITGFCTERSRTFRRSVRICARKIRGVSTCSSYKIIY